MVPIQLKIFTPVGIAMSIVASENTESAIGPMPVENMWWLHTPKPEEGDEAAREDHRGVAEQRLAREHRQDLGDDAEGRQDQDVHLGMPEHPEQVLPEHRVTATERHEEVGAEEPVEHEQDQRDRDDGEREEHQQLRDEAHPHEHRHPDQLHARAPAC